MKKRIRNPQRSLEMVVSASLDECVAALHSLERGGWFAERVKVTIRNVEHDLVEFSVQRTIDRRTTSVRGTLRADENYDTITIVGEAPPANRKMMPGLLIYGTVLGVIVLLAMVSWASITSNGQTQCLLIFFLLMIPFSLWSTFYYDRDDTSHLISIVEKAIKEKSNGKTHTQPTTLA